MISLVDICNKALGHLGQKPITSLNDATTNALKCKMSYESVRDSVLRAHAWSFATKILPLALLDEEEVLGWDYLYAYPSNCLYVREVLNEGTVGSGTTQKFEELLSPDTNTKCIACNLEQAYARFTIRVTDPNLYDANFIEAYALKLAAEVSPALTNDDAKSAKLLQLYNNSIDVAKLTNLSERSVPVEQNSSFIYVR